MLTEITQRIAELEFEVEQLRNENTRLRWLIAEPDYRGVLSPDDRVFVPIPPLQVYQIRGIGDTCLIRIFNPQPIETIRLELSIR